MEHDLAIETNLAERYILGELSLQEREEFEEHFFDCAECTEQVQHTAVFADNALHALQSQTWAERTSANSQATAVSMFDWMRRPIAFPLLAGACAVLLAVNGLQFWLLRDAKQELAAVTSPQTINSTTLIQTRSVDEQGFLPKIDLRSGARFFELVIDVSPGSESPIYRYTLNSVAGFSEQGSVPAPQDQGPLRLLLPASGFAAGRYTLRVESGGGRSQDYRFEIQR